MRNVDYFDRSATLWPERTLLITDQGEISYRRMQALTREAATIFVEQRAALGFPLLHRSPGAGTPLETLAGQPDGAGAGGQGNA